MDTSSWVECKLCGAVVSSQDRHERWHAAIDDIDSTADDALTAAQEAERKADEAANVLYQNNISV